VATWLYSLFIQEHLKLFNPVASVATVAVYVEYSSPEMIHIEIYNIPESDEAIFKTPVTSGPLSGSKIDNCN
jgi:hypothetical protein